MCIPTADEIEPATFPNITHVLNHWSHSGAMTMISFLTKVIIRLFYKDDRIFIGILKNDVLKVTYVYNKSIKYAYIVIEFQIQYLTIITF